MDELERARRVLGLDADATRADVHTAFRRAAKTHHPDAGGDAAAFVELRWAFERALEAAPADPTPAMASGTSREARPYRRHWYLDRVDPNPIVPRVVSTEGRMTDRAMRPRSSQPRARVVAAPSFASVLARQLRHEPVGV